MSAAADPSLRLIFGGTFDPVHRGHLHLATALGRALHAQEIRILPGNLPPHRPPPVAAAEHRLEMVRRAAVVRNWRVDDREIRRGGVSRTVDTLRELRAEAGSAPLCLALGMDAFVLLDQWYEWRSVSDYVHLTVCARAGVTAPASGAVAELLAERCVSSAADLHSSSSGNIWISEIQPLDCSAHQIRSALSSGDFTALRCLPPPVWEYIRTQGLYGVRADERG